jgi:GxxExxY protein
MEHEALTRTVIGSGMKVHRIMGPGYLESVYKNALTLELRARGLRVDREVHFSVHYEGSVVGDYSADMFVEGCILVEAKAVRVLAPKHEAQLVSYLTATRLDVGLLINFGSERLEVKRKTRTYRPPTLAPSE